MAQFKIYEGNMERLKKKMVRIKNKCHKYGCDFNFEEVGEEFTEINNDDGGKTIVRYVIVKAEGKAVINGWKYVASLEHHTKGNVILKCCDDIEVPDRYYTSPIVCEHCGINRARSKAHIVYNENTGEFKEVGTNCLCDFTNGMSAEAAASFIAMFDDLIKGEAPDGGYFEDKYYDKEEILRYAAETVSIYGYEKSDGYGPGTKDRTFDFWLANNRGDMLGRRCREVLLEMDRKHFDANSKRAKEMTKNALSWIKEQEEENNYMHNLKLVCDLDYVTYKDFGFLVSLFPTWLKAKEIEAKNEARRKEMKKESEESEWIGEVGKRIEFKIKSMIPVTGWDTDFGHVTVFKLVDENGNVFTWKTNKCITSENGVESIKGTVKEHKEYRGVKQTEITRCRLTEKH